MEVAPDAIFPVSHTAVSEVEVCVALSLLVQTTFVPTGTCRGLVPKAAVVLPAAEVGMVIVVTPAVVTAVVEEPH